MPEFMDGVEWLATSKVMTEGQFALVMIGVLCIIFGVAISTASDPRVIMELCIVFLGVALVVIGGVRYYYNPDYTYQVTIDDSVSMNEFNARYKVLSQDGRIFTIEVIDDAR